MLEASPASKPALAPVTTPCVETLVGSEKRCLKPGDNFKDCPECPEMVVVPAGEFMMGSGQKGDEGPLHKVMIAKPFAVGKFEVTFTEWSACKIADSCRQNPSDESWGKSNRPVINVSWFDTKEYVAWLAKKTDKTYRLLTESEWEYAARAGSRAEYTWGDEIGRDRANCDGCNQRAHKQTTPVGSYPPNSFGLHDMQGNVWEWVEDCYEQGYYVRVTTDGSARSSSPANCSRRTIRGGSWIDNSHALRSAFRMGGYPHERSFIRGFRVARTLNP
jgi:formylglycine-generating enzyme required for sulfatase activity